MVMEEKCPHLHDRTMPRSINYASSNLAIVILTISKSMPGLNKFGSRVFTVGLESEVSSAVTIKWQIQLLGPSLFSKVIQMKIGVMRIGHSENLKNFFYRV